MDLQINLEGRSRTRDESGWNKGSNGYLFSRDETILAPLKALLQIVVVLPWRTTLSNKDSRLLHLSGCRSISSSRDVEQRASLLCPSSRILFLLYWGGGRGDLSGTVTPHRRVSIESTGNWILNRAPSPPVTHRRVVVVVVVE